MARRKKIEKDLMKIALFIIFDGLILHEAISSMHPDINSLRLAPTSGLIDFLKAEWEKILKKDYQPVFELAYVVLMSFPTSPNTDVILKRLSSNALKVISSGVLLKHDFMGRLYHKLLLKTTGKYYATYYTSIPAAWILSYLTIKTQNPDLDWHFEDLENLKTFKVLDPACGSGTLLSGIYMAIKDKYILDRYASDDPKSLDLNNYHKIMLENVLNGWDILEYAGHLTLTNLALHNHRATFSDSNLYTLRVGLIDRVIHLGSLDYLDDELRLVGRGFSTSPKKKGMVADREEVIKFVKHMDVVIMNPPFSRSAGKVNIKFGYEKKDIMQRMNKQLRKLGKRLGYDGIGQAGIGAYFIVFGNKSLKKGGRLALVIPRAFLSGVSWNKIRRGMLLKDYEIEYVVSNCDPGEKKLGIEPWNWSENTNLGEVLIVARKTDKSYEERFTTFINLWNKPKNEIESLKIVADSTKSRQKKDLMFFEGGNYDLLHLHKEVGVVYNISQKLLEKNSLIPCLFAHPHLNKLGFELIYNNLIPLVPLSNLSKGLGIDRKQIEQEFKLVHHNTPYPILWGHPESINTIELNRYQFASHKKKRAELTYNRKKGNLLIAERIWTNTLSVISLFSRIPILATMFWEVQVGIIDAKILSMWFNTTFGFVLSLASSINNGGNWFNLKKNQLANLPTLDITMLTKRDKVRLINFFEKVKEDRFHNFHKEFELAFMGSGLRKELDDMFIKILGLEINLKPYYEMLSREPVISLQRL